MYGSKQEIQKIHEIYIVLFAKKIGIMLNIFSQIQKIKKNLVMSILASNYTTVIQHNF